MNFNNGNNNNNNKTNGNQVRCVFGRLKGSGFKATVMDNGSNLMIYHKLRLLIKDLYRVVHNMKREYKYTIGNETLAISWSCMDLFSDANNSPDSEKLSGIQALSVLFDKLKLRLRMMEEIKLISEKQFSYFSENYILPIGKMIGGWKKWAEKTTTLR